MGVCNWKGASPPAPGEGEAPPVEWEELSLGDVRVGNIAGEALPPALEPDEDCIILRDDNGRFIVARWCGGESAGVARCQHFLRRWQQQRQKDRHTTQRRAAWIMWHE